jgi:hypothetical protein
VHYWNPRRLATAGRTTEKKNRRDTQQNRDHRLANIAFILVLMQRKPRVGPIAIDETSIGLKLREACLPCGCCREFKEGVRMDGQFLPLPGSMSS